jgi:hypothetical protein
VGSKALGHVISRVSLSCLLDCKSYRDVMVFPANRGPAATTCSRMELYVFARSLPLTINLYWIDLFFRTFADLDQSPNRQNALT